MPAVDGGISRRWMRRRRAIKPKSTPVNGSEIISSVHLTNGMRGRFVAIKAAPSS